MSTMYCECEIKSVTKSGVDLELSVVPVGAFKLSFRHDDERIEYAILSASSQLTTHGRTSNAKLQYLKEGEMDVKCRNVNKKAIESSMLIAAAAAKSKVRIGIEVATKKPLQISSVELC